MKYDTVGTYKVTLKAVDACGNTTEVERTINVEGAVAIIGADDITINQGIGIDLTEGVSATGVKGQDISYDVNPETIEKCDVGEHEVIYTATDAGITGTVTRIVTIAAIDDPIITGLTDLTVEVGKEFDPLEGVTAKDGNGNDIEVEIVKPQPQDIVLIDVTNYTATNDRSLSLIKPNDWGLAGDELVVEAEDVVIVQDGVEYPTSVSYAGWDGSGTIVVQPSPVGEIGSYCYVWFYTDANDDTKFFSIYATESEERVPDEVRFGKLIVKRASGN